MAPSQECLIVHPKTAEPALWAKDSKYGEGYAERKLMQAIGVLRLLLQHPQEHDSNMALFYQ